jgi:hypothetical protein
MLLETIDGANNFYHNFTPAQQVTCQMSWSELGLSRVILLRESHGQTSIHMVELN